MTVSARWAPVSAVVDRRGSIHRSADLGSSIPKAPVVVFFARLAVGLGLVMKKKNCAIRPAHAVPLASARQHPENHEGKTP